MEKKSSITRRQFESPLEEQFNYTQAVRISRRGKGILKVTVFQIVFLSVKTESTLYHNNAVEIRSQDNTAVMHARVYLLYLLKI